MYALPKFLGTFHLANMQKKTVEYLKILHLKVAFKSCSCQMPILKVKPSKLSAHLRAEAKISKIGWMPLEIQDFCSHSVQVESWQNFKCCRCAKFSPCHCKSKIPGHLKLSTLKLSTQMPTRQHQNSSRDVQRFRKSGTWIPNVERRYRLNFCRIFARHSVQVESGKISNVVDVQSFHLAIAKVKYLGTWNFPPKCPPSTSSSWGKDFENRLNTVDDIGFLLAQCTGWKWQNFKCCRCAKFSPCHCKSKIPGHLKLSTQMSTLTSSSGGKYFENRLNAV